MEKLLIMISELKVNSNYISPDIKEIEHLCGKVSESLETYQARKIEIQDTTQEVANSKREEDNLFIEIKNIEEEFSSSMDKLEILKSEYENLSKLEEYELGAFERISDLEHQFKIFGITVEACFLESTVTQAKILFAEDKFVILNYDLNENIYDLQKIEPSHLHFEEMRRFLLESGDIAGFLCYVNLFFK